MHSISHNHSFGGIVSARDPSRSNMRFNSGSKFYINNILIISILVALNSGCQPKKAEETRDFDAEIQKSLKTVNYENEAATPTYPAINSENQENLKKYNLEYKKITNVSNVEILTGNIRLNDTKISYSSETQKMIITGSAILFDGNKNESVKVLSQKEFKLVGQQIANQPNFTLKDEIQTTDSSPMFIRAEARCIDRFEDNDPNCNHVIVDIYIIHQKKTHTEQIEVNRKEKKKSNVTPDAPESPVAPQPPASSPAPIVEGDEADASTFQQKEGDDLSIAGRYKGGAEIIDLTTLFADVEDEHKPTELIPPKTNTQESQEAPKKEDPHDKIINSRFLQMKDGTLRPIDQAIGFPDKGFIKNSTSLLLKQEQLKNNAYFEVVSPSREKHFGTYEMAEIISRMASDFFKQFSKTLFLSNISSAKGGKLEPHVSHQNGLDADIAYPTELKDVKFPVVVKMSNRQHNPNNYSVEKTYKLFKYLFSQSDIKVTRIFIDNEIKKDLCKYAIEKNELAAADKDLVQKMFSNLQHVDGHGDHFHMRLECSKYDPACRDRIYVKTEICQPLIQK